MKFFYKFANLFGSVYNRGDLNFDPKGSCLYSPCGNKIVLYDLKNGRSRALSFQSEYNVNHLTISPNGRLLLVSTEKCQLYMVSPITGYILHRKDYQKTAKAINGIQFSSDGRYYALLVDNKALIYLTPGIAFTGSGRELSPFKIHKVLKAHYSDTTFVAWSPDSQLVAVGSKDTTVKVFGVSRSHPNIPMLINLAGHSDELVGGYFGSFSHDDLSLITISKNGQCFVWEASYSTDDLKSIEPREDKLNFSRSGKHYFNDALKSNASHVYVSSTAYNAQIHLLVTGFTNGSVLLHDMPDFSLIYSLELSNLGSIDGITINMDSDWIAFASETFILKQSGTGSGFTHITECLSYSPDGSYLATGGTDAKVRVWDTIGGFCFVTFSEEHKAPITAVEFQPNSGGKVLISASLDGTVRAFDLNRYRNFRTLAAPSASKPAQFISLAVDYISSDFIAAGAQNFFEIFLWSLKTGRLLDCLTGHEAPVSAVKFSPTNNILVSCSWDKTVRTWNLFEGANCTREVLQLGSDAIGLAYRLDGNQIAVSTINGNIYFFSPESGEMLGAPIEGKHDLGLAKTNEEESGDDDKHFNSLCYSIDGQYILAGGRSKHLCLYHAPEKLLVKKFTLTCNKSLEGIFDYISKRKRAEFGFNEALIKAREEGDFAPVRLPGVKRGDLGDRSVNPIVSAYSLQFSPTMRAFAAATTEGILIYSLDTVDYFDPYELDEGISPLSVKESLDNQQYADALMQSLKLRDQKLFTMVIESTPINSIDLTVKSLPVKYIEMCLSLLATALESTAHIEFYILWCQSILRQHGLTLKANYSNASQMSATFRLLHRVITRWSDDLQKVADLNKYRLMLIQTFGDTHNLQEIDSQ
uniref:Small-subunit processome Utp12 domain-containing protein n=1 Tax=Tetranychus urticae TaxID=32264 RepID=T1KXW6_TETUR